MVYSFYVNPVKNELHFTQCDTSILDSVKQLCILQQQQNVLNVNTKKFVGLSNAIYQRLFHAVVKQNETKSMIVLAEGMLSNLAMDALITDTNKINSFLVKQYSISYAYSLRSLITQQKRDFSKQSSVLITAPFTKNSIRKLPSLQNSGLEANQISTYFETNSLCNHIATFTNFKNALAKNNVIHIASHASANETPRIEFYDSSIAVNSIYQLPMNQQLAYLNTCQSGLGANYYGEGNLSLGRAFYSNGIHNIILTLWNMNDVSSSNISNLFYKHLKESNNSITALHEAKLDYLSHVPLDQQSPYYWASLQHIGDGKMTDQHDWANWVKWFLISLLTGTSLYFLFKKRKSLLNRF